MFGERLKRARVKQGLSLELLANKADNIVTKQPTIKTLYF
jgi:transcriptional regulator with XRE-family HTH domain